MSLQARVDRLEAMTAINDPSYRPLLLIEVEADWTGEQKQAAIEAAYQREESRSGLPRPGPGTGISAVVVELRRDISDEPESTP